MTYAELHGNMQMYRIKSQYDNKLNLPTIEVPPAAKLSTLALADGVVNRAGESMNRLSEMVGVKIEEVNKVNEICKRFSENLGSQFEMGKKIAPPPSNKRL